MSPSPALSIPRAHLSGPDGAQHGARGRGAAEPEPESSGRVRNQEFAHQAKCSGATQGSSGGRLAGRQASPDVFAEGEADETLRLPPAGALGSGLLRATRAAYDELAGAYDAAERSLMAERPVDLGHLFAFAKSVHAHRPGGLVGDVGCGPGQVARWMCELGLAVRGIDLSPRMIERARRNAPDARFIEGEAAELEEESGAWAGALVLGALWHAEAGERAVALGEVARVVQPGGALLYGWLSSGAGQPSGTVYPLEHWLGVKVALPVYLCSIKAAALEVRRAGFEVVAATEREPLVHELPLRRGFLLARRRQPA